MKNQSKSIARLITAIIVVGIISSTFITSCKKSKGEKANAKFVGTWHGSGSCGVMGYTAPVDSISFVLVAGATDNSLTTTQTVGSDSSCLKPVTINLTANGNNLVMPSQSFTDLCGNAQPISGSGTLSGTTLTMTESMGITASGLPLTVTCTFTVTK
jgi:hypothetical protein